jgi:hypothetical protein
MRLKKHPPYSWNIPAGLVRALVKLLVSGALASLSASAQAPAVAPYAYSPEGMRDIYVSSVDKRLDIPAEVARDYAQRAHQALNAAGLIAISSQYLLLVDRNPNVQAILLLWKPESEWPQLIGASPVSTGKTGRFDYFESPLGVFDHSIDNPDFRAEGTRNDNGIRGYGAKGMRVFDFGWQQSRKGWGDRAVSTMRLQLHATDPDFLEPRLGTVQSKGCIRIPATLNRLIDHYGLLDADYFRAAQSSSHLWVLDPERKPTPWPGRYLIVVESSLNARPAWAWQGRNQK